MKMTFLKGLKKKINNQSLWRKSRKMLKMISFQNSSLCNSRWMILKN